MLHLLTLEWKKVRKNSTFRVLFVLYLILLPSLFLVGKRLPDLPDEIPSADVFYMFPTVWEYLAYAGNWLVFFFLGFLAVLSVTVEYNNKTLRQNVITGLTRTEIFKAKLSYIIALSFVATAYYFIVAIVIGFFNTETIYWVKIWQEWEMIPRYFLMCLGYTSFALLLGLLIKRTGIALFLYLSYVMFIEVVLRWAVHRNLFDHKSMHFYPMNAIEDLTPFPLLKTAKNFGGNDMKFEILLSPSEAVGTVIVYTALFLFCSYGLLRRSSL